MMENNGSGVKMTLLSIALNLAEVEALFGMLGLTYPRYKFYPSGKLATSARPSVEILGADIERAKIFSEIEEYLAGGKTDNKSQHSIF